MWGAYVGSPVERQSLKFFFLEECIEGENPFVAGTYEKILEAVAKPAREKATIRLETKVVKVISDESQTKPELEIADGTRLAFDEVVCTMPLGMCFRSILCVPSVSSISHMILSVLRGISMEGTEVYNYIDTDRNYAGWLKRNQDAFEPPLKPRLAKAISSIGYGTLDKVYITFPEAFWNNNSNTPAPSEPKSVDPDNKTPNVTATTQPLHQTSTTNKHQQHQQSHHYPGFTHWLAPTYASQSNPQQWDQQGMNLAALPDETAHPTLLFYIYGPCATYIASLASSTASPPERDQVLIDWFTPYISLLPNYNSSIPACKPTGALATAWANDEFAGYGSYANFQVGLEEGDEDIEVMREGLPERGVWFAGEHTAPFAALGTSTGAYWSGEGVGRRIVEVRGRKERKENAEVP